VARPTKYTPERVKAITDALVSGSTRTAACGNGDITLETLADWMSRYPEFSVTVTRAEAKAELRFTNTLAAAAAGTDEVPGDWRAAESWLKRRRRDDWGDTVKSEISGPSGEAIRVRHEMANLKELSDDELLRLHSETLERQG
jgi:hypothetical protein